MALSQSPARTASHRPAAPADPQAVLSFLAAGHTTLETATRFGITERSVRRIRQRQDERDEQRRRMQRLAAQSPAEPPVARPTDPVTPPPAIPHFVPARATDVAGKGVLWRCPISGELTPVPPGSIRGEWEAERRSPAVSMALDTAPRVDMTDRPDIRTGPPFTALESATDTGLADVQTTLPPPSAEHNTTPLIAKYYPPRPAPRPRPTVDLGPLVEVLTYQIGPVPVAGVLVFLLLLLWLGMR